MLHDQTNEIKNRHKQRHETYEIEHEFKARRAQGGKGLISHAISIHELKKSIPKRGEGERSARERGRGMLSRQKGERESVRG